MKTLLKYIIYTNIVVALSAGFLSAGFCYRLNIQNWLLYGLFSFFATLSVYNGQRLFKTRQNKETDWLIWVKNHYKILLGLVIFSFSVACILFFILNQNNVIIYLLFLLVSFVSALYVVRIKGQNLRELPYIKIHAIAFSWVVVLILFPLLNESVERSTFSYIFLFYFYIIAVTIPFDIRDLKYDLPQQKTIPQLIGVKGAKMTSISLFILFVVLILRIDQTLQANYIFFLSVAIQLILLALINKNRSDFYSAGLIDGAIGVMGLSLFF